MDAVLRGAISRTTISGGAMMDVGVLLAAGQLGVARLRFRPAVVGPFPDGGLPSRASAISRICSASSSSR